MRDLLKSLADQGRTILVSSHLLSEMQVLADDVAIIRHRQPSGRGTVTDIIGSMGAPDASAHAENRKLLAALGPSATSTTTADGALVVRADGPTIGAAAMAAGAQIHELTMERPDLENVFLQLTAGKAEIR
jgi:ABC-2 type transport system ATP-binding protein